MDINHMTRQAPTTTGSVILTQTSVAGRNVVLEQPYGVPQVNNMLIWQSQHSLKYL